MARRRMIDPNFWSSEDVSKLSLFDRLLLIGLISNADDYGKGRAKPEFLRSIIFPYDDISIDEIKNSLIQIEKNISIIFYEIENSRYYKFINWSKWQRVDKPQKSLLPDPPELIQNYSENNSKNDSENDSCLKEDKRKEEKRKEEKRSEDTPTQIFLTTYNKKPTAPEKEIIQELINKFGNEKTLEIFKQAKLKNFKSLLTLKNSLDTEGNITPYQIKDNKTYTLQELQEKHKNSYYYGAKYDPIANEYTYIPSINRYIKYSLNILLKNSVHLIFIICIKKNIIYFSKVNKLFLFHL
ncbi:MAG: hypothetical protein QXM96_03200 [Candidatus Woesearchaeota archaeon]